MRRVLTVLCLVGLAGFAVFALGAGGGGGSGGSSYWVELDNAFGLVKGGDMKVAGVRAGKITDLKLDQKTKQALIHFKVTQGGFGSLRTDVSCDTRPQSLIGEYFLDCQPGSSTQNLKAGSVIPVTRTSSTVAPDLVNDILRDPYKQRLRILVNEFGAATAGNAANLNAAIRRASPALRQTNQVLAILAKQNQTLANLARDGDAVLSALAANKKNVARFVDTAGKAASASAERKAALAEGFRRLPGFLAELQPAMHELGNVADSTTPALRNLDASATQLKTFFDRLGPFSTVSTPAFKSLGQASQTGNQAVLAAQPTVAELTKFAQGVPELGKNLAVVLAHLDDRSHAVEKDPRSPGGQGYTGLEALLSYVYDQSLSTNVYDANVHYLKVAIDSSDCAHYADIAHAKPLEAKCAARIGPNAIGFNFEDTTKGGDGSGSGSSANQADRTAGGVGPLAPPPTLTAPLPGAPDTGGAAQGAAPAAPPATGGPQAPGAPAPAPTPTPPVIQLPGLPQPGGGGGGDLPRPPIGQRIGLSAAVRDARSTQLLLDYLLGP
jgi:virulence factor Mce-like protein